MVGCKKIRYGIYGRGDVDRRLQLRGLDLVTGTTVAPCLGTAAAVYGFDTLLTADLHVLNPPGLGHLPLAGDNCGLATASLCTGAREHR